MKRKLRCLQETEPCGFSQRGGLDSRLLHREGPPPYLFFMPKLFALLLLCSLTLAANAQDVPVPPNPSSRIFQFAKVSTLSLAGEVDDLCMLEAAFSAGYRQRAASRVELDGWVRPCVQFDRGVGAWYISNSAASGRPVVIDSDEARKTLVGFQRGSQLWLYLTLKKCSAAGAQSADACMALTQKNR